MGVVLKLAIRNTLRNRRRSIFIVFALMFASTGFCFYASMLHGFYGNMIDNLVATQAGDAVIRSDTWIEESRAENFFDADQEWVRSLSENPAVAHMVPRVELPCFLTSAHGGRPVLAVGVDPHVEHGVSSMAQSLSQGTYLKPGDLHQAVVGKSLADQLDLKLGARLVFMASGRSGEVESRMARLVGIFKTEGVMGARLVHLPIDLTRDLLGTKTQSVTQIGVLRVDGVSRSSLVEIVRGVAPAGHSVQNWEQAMPQLASFFHSDMAGMLLIMSVLVIVVSLGVWNLVLIGVSARKHEFGVMSAVGMGPSRIAMQIIIETLILSSLAIGLGVVIGYGLVDYAGTVGIPAAPGEGETTSMGGFEVSRMVFPNWHPPHVYPAVASLWLFSALASLPPALKAAKNNPTETLQGGP
jgi:ABC-type lipoprotein release transport system permease subunit